MSEVTPAAALELRQAILSHDRWNESMPEFAGLPYEGFVALESGSVVRERLPAATLARLGIAATDAADDSQFQVSLGRRSNRRFSSLSHMYDRWPDGQPWDPSFVYDDLGRDTAFIHVGRASQDMRLVAQYTISAEESYEPGQPPLCDVQVEMEDQMPMRRLIIELGQKGGSLNDVAVALGINPETGERDLDKPAVTSDADLRINLANQLGEPLSQHEIAELRADETVAAEMQAVEAQLQPLTNQEILGLAALARTVVVYPPC